MFLSFAGRRNRMGVSGGLVLAASLVTTHWRRGSPRCSANQSGRCSAFPSCRKAVGLAASRRTPDRFWSHNDSGDPVLFALDEATHRALPLNGSAI